MSWPVDVPRSPVISSARPAGHRAVSTPGRAVGRRSRGLPSGPARASARRGPHAAWRGRDRESRDDPTAVIVELGASTSWRSVARRGSSSPVPSAAVRQRAAPVVGVARRMRSGDPTGSCARLEASSFASPQTEPAVGAGRRARGGTSAVHGGGDARERVERCWWSPRMRLREVGGAWCGGLRSAALSFRDFR